MSFLSDIAADLKASASKAASSAYQNTLDKAQEAANKLFTTAAVGPVADIQRQTLPSTANLQQLVAPLTSTPSGSPDIAGALPPSSSKRYIVVVLVLLAIIYFLKKD